MKKILLLIVPVLFLTGCGAEPIEEKETKNYAYYMQDSRSFEFYVDKKTCVEYIEYDGGYSGNLIPRLNADGTLILNENCLENKEE